MGHLRSLRYSTLSNALRGSMQPAAVVEVDVFLEVVHCFGRRGIQRDRGSS